MKKRLLIQALALALASAPPAAYGAASISGSSCCTAQAAQQPADSKIPMQSVQQFGHDLMGQYLKETNPVMSPVSAYVMLGMAGSGTKGAAKKEFQTVLGSDMLSVSEDLMRTLPVNKDGVQLTIANSAWLDDEFTPKQKWLKAAETQFQSDVFQADLGTNAAKKKINQWVSDRTNKRIPKLLEKKLDKETRLALVNALYFHADWQQRFLPESTGKNNFRLEDGTTKKIDMMHGTIHNCGYLKDDVSEGVVLPYKDSSFAFAAVKPSGEESIRDWYASYSAQKLAALVNGREDKTVELALPKFEARCRMNLNDSLKNMGIKRAFDEKKADFTLLGKSKDEENLYLSLVLQEAVISVAEEGTEAAAATIGAVAAGTAFMPDMPVVHFDRPFLYMIVDLDSGVPVFMGIMDEP